MSLLSRVPVRIYRVGTSFYYMKQLTFGENKRVTKLMADHLGDVFTAQITVEDMLQILYEKGAIADVFDILMRPVFKGSPHFREVIDDLPERKVARMMRDFFVLNPHWMHRFVGTALINNLPERKRKELVRVLHGTHSTN